MSKGIYYLNGASPLLAQCQPVGKSGLTMSRIHFVKHQHIFEFKTIDTHISLVSDSGSMSASG